MGYIITGVLAGPSLFDIIHNQAAFESFSEIGIALLLFIVGLGLNVTTIVSLGKPVFVVAMSNAMLLGPVSYLVAWLLLGMKPVEALIVAIALLFSSTIVVIKALSDKKATTRLFGRVSIGVTLVEDVMATVALILVVALTGGATLRDFRSAHHARYLTGSGVLSSSASFIMPRSD